MSLTLKNIVDTYLQDEAFLDAWREIAAQRQASISHLQPIVEQFITGAININQMRDRLYQTLRNDPAAGLNDWGARGAGFLLELNKADNHPHPEIDEELRKTLDSINRDNLGERIDYFSDVVQQQRIFLKQQDIAWNILMFPGNTAFLLSLFTFWLNPANPPYICYPTLREGVAHLINHGLLPASAGLSIERDKLSVTSRDQYEALNTTLDALLATYPALKISGIAGFGIEAFMSWVKDNLDRLLDSEAEEEIGAAISDRVIIDDLPLSATPEPLLSRLIAEIQQQILISEEVIRSIYYALLAGHVILTGPPGTGKTHLATLLPEILWQTEEPAGSSIDPYGNPVANQRVKTTAYTTRVVTATDEWSVRTLIGGLAPKSNPSGGISYPIQPGHLTQTVLENWNLDFHTPTAWEEPARARVRGVRNQEFRGRWLVIDEFNRAPIDIAFGEALTTLGGSNLLRVPVNSQIGSAELPLPKDFRIIGTLNSFDRNYLNRISEAMKRRFKSIEILPPARAMRTAEKAIVLRKAFERIAHLRDANILDQVTNQDALKQIFDQVWHVFEVIRIYRQLGTAQAISFTHQALIEGLLRDYTTENQWSSAFDLALCSTIADQLQVLLPDELAVIVDYLGGALTPDVYLARFQSLNDRRQSAQLQALQRIDETIEAQANITEAAIDMLFPQPQPELPRFRKRLHSYSTERGL